MAWSKTIQCYHNQQSCTTMAGIMLTHHDVISASEKEKSRNIRFQLHSLLPLLIKTKKEKINATQTPRRYKKICPCIFPTALQP